MKWKYLLTLVLILAITAVVHRAWLLSLSVIIGSDWGFFFPQTMQEWFPIHSIWNPQLNFGYYDFVSVPFLIPYFLRGLLAILNIDFTIIDRLLYLYPIALITPLGMFFLCYRLTKSLLSSLLGSLMYSINTYILTIQIGHFTLAFVYAIFPVIFLIFSLFLKKPKYPLLIAFIFLFIASFANEARITFLSTLILILYFIFSLIFERKSYSLKKLYVIGRYLSIGVLFIIGLLSFFIVPLYFVRDIGIQDFAGRGFFGADFFLIQNAFTLFHPFWDGTITTEFILQPIPLYFWLLPIYVFSALFFYKKDKNILFFAGLALLGVFLSKGITAPFGEIYNWLYFNFPGFSFFREPSKFYFITAFSYSVLIAYLFTYATSFFATRIKNKVIYTIILLIIILPLVFLFSITAKPAVQGTLASAFRETVVPKEYSALQKFLLDDSEFFRTMYVPNRQRFEFLSANNPSIAYLGIPETMRTLNPEILKLFSVKYVILPYDSTNDVYRHYSPRHVWEQKIEKIAGLKKVNKKEFGEISVYENTNGYLPHIYAATNKIYIDGDIPLNKIDFLLPDDKNALYFTTSPYNAGRTVDQNIFNSQYFVARCIQCDEEAIGQNVQIPFARILPDSPFYFIVKEKEQQKLKVLPEGSQAYYQELAFYSLKRIVEVQTAYNQYFDLAYIKRIIADHSLITDKLSTYYDKISNENLENNDFLLSLADHVYLERRILSDILFTEGLDEELHRILQNEYYKLDTVYYKLNKKIWKSTNEIKRYIVDIPEDVNSEITVQTHPNIPNFVLEIDKKEQVPVAISESEVSFGENRLQKGKHAISLRYTEPKNLVSTSSATVTVTNNEGVKKIKIPISNFREGDEMIVSFRYQIPHGKPPRFFLSQNADRTLDGIREVQIDQNLKMGNEWHTAWAKVTPKEGATVGTLEFWIETDHDDAVLRIEDLKVESAREPIVVVRTKKKPVSINPVDVSIKTLSPTHYQAIISNARQPLMLVFNEQFHNGWQASIGKESIPQEKHVEVNGYANAWFIDKAGNYVVDITFSPQKYYQIGIVISLITLFIVLLSLVIYRNK